MFFSGATDVSFIDPVVIGRNVFSVTNDFASGIAEYIQGVLCTVIDVILDTYHGKVRAVTFHILAKSLFITMSILSVF